MKVTVPVGILAVPGTMSATVAVQVAAVLTTTVVGEQATVTVGILRVVARLVLPVLGE